MQRGRALSRKIEIPKSGNWDNLPKSHDIEIHVPIQRELRNIIITIIT